MKRVYGVIGSIVLVVFCLVLLDVLLTAHTGQADVAVAGGTEAEGVELAPVAHCDLIVFSTDDQEWRVEPNDFARMTAEEVLNFSVCYHLCYALFHGPDANLHKYLAPVCERLLPEWTEVEGDTE